MDRRDWLVYPWQVDARVAEWQRRFPDLVSVDTLEQYTRHKVHAVTVTERSVPDEGKRKHLFFVPHAHEPAATAGCMNAIEQLLTGHHLDGAPSTLLRERLLREAVLTFIPDTNPYGRSRCPEPWWDGRRYNNREFINMVFGIGDLFSDEPLTPRWARFKRAGSFTVRDEAPARIGLAYEQVGEYEYVEPNRGDERCTGVKLVNRLRQRYRYDRVLNLHQTEFEGAEPFANCMIIPPALLHEFSEERQGTHLAWAEAIMDAWRSVGGSPTPVAAGDRRWSGLHAQSATVPWADLQRESDTLLVEIQNNSPLTPAEQQLLLFDVAIWSSIEHMLGA